MRAHLIDGARNETRDLTVLAEDLREGVGEGGSGLNGDKVALGDRIAVRGP